MVRRRNRPREPLYEEPFDDVPFSRGFLIDPNWWELINTLAKHPRLVGALALAGLVAGGVTVYTSLYEPFTLDLREPAPAERIDLPDIPRGPDR